MLVAVGFTRPDKRGRYQLPGQNAVLNFFARVYPRLRGSGRCRWKSGWNEAARTWNGSNRISTSPSGSDGLISMSHSQSGDRFSAAEIQLPILSGQSHAAEEWVDR